jgi:hypothetical protein
VVLHRGGGAGGRMAEGTAVSRRRDL